MDNWLKNPWVIRFISLVLAVLLYVAVSLSQNTGTDDRMFPSNGTNQTNRLSNVPVEIIMDDDKDYAVSGIPETVVVDLEGSNSAITPIIRQSTLDIYADLREYGTGTHQVNLQYSGVSENVNVYIEPRTVEVTIEERKTEEFTVEVDYMNESLMAEGLEIGEATVEPGTVTIESAESQVDRVAIVKAYVNMEGVESSVDSRAVPVNVYDSQGNELNVRVNPEMVTVSVEVQTPSKDIPVEISTTGELPNNLVLDSITADPAVVTVFGSEETLEGISEITTEPVDLSDISQSTEQEVGLEVPTGIQRIEQEQVNVSVEVEELESSAFESIEVQPENLSVGRSIRFINEGTNAMQVIVFGEKEQLYGLTKDDIQLFIDLKDVAGGEQILPVNANVTGNLITELEHDQLTVLVE